MERVRISGSKGGRERKGETGRREGRRSKEEGEGVLLELLETAASLLRARRR